MLLIRAAPATGKTSLLQQLEDHLKRQGRRVGVLHLQRAYLQRIGENERNAEDFDTFFEKAIGATWQDCLDPQSTEDYVLLVDETQKIYTDYAPAFWLRIKSIAAIQGECRVHAVFFSVYGDTSQSPTVPAGRGTPFIPNASLGADFLQCSLNETKALVEDFSKRTGTVHLPEIGPVLQAFTGGHIGMLRAILEALYHYFKRLTGKPYNLETAVNFLLSVQALNAIRYCIRSPPDFVDLNEDCLAMVHSIINSPSGSVSIEDGRMDTAHSLMTRCIVQWTSSYEKQVCFISPAVLRIAINALCASPRPDKEANTLTEFLVQVLPKIRSDFLQHNMGSGGDALLEPAWQMEFYHASTSILSVNSHISPSVGRLFDSTGQLDFYVNGDKCWLIEITREGDRLPEHVARFQPPGGRYCKIPCKGSVILDFRRIRPHLSTVVAYDLVWFVVYDETYAGATIVRKGHPDLKIEFTAPPLTEVELRQREGARIKAMLEEANAVGRQEAEARMAAERLEAEARAEARIREAEARIAAQINAAVEAALAKQKDSPNKNMQS